ncbi:MAG: hypothetical protein VX367_05390, partial [SAR324 cluster bacterium]|nr:hypothetical protein [SAR324 cluster bacterium]
TNDHQSSLIFFNVPECLVDQPGDRVDHDASILTNLITSTLMDEEEKASIIKLFRLGAKGEKLRPLKPVSDNPEVSVLSLSTGWHSRGNQITMHADLSIEDRERQRSAVLELKR